MADTRMRRRKVVAATSVSIAALEALDRLHLAMGRTNSSLIREAIYDFLRKHDPQFNSPVEEDEELDETA